MKSLDEIDLLDTKNLFKFFPIPEMDLRHRRQFEPDYKPRFVVYDQFGFEHVFLDRESAEQFIATNKETIE